MLTLRLSSSRKTPYVSSGADTSTVDSGADEARPRVHTLARPGAEGTDKENPGVDRDMTSPRTRTAHLTNAFALTIVVSWAHE